jgi:hypothetical protein
MFPHAQLSYNPFPVVDPGAFGSEWGRESPRDFQASNALPVFHGTGRLLRLAVNTIKSQRVMAVERPSLRLGENGKFTQC